MNIIKLAILIGFLCPIALSAQKKEKSVLNDFNTWSLEINAGMNNAITPFGEGYSASNESKFFSSSFNHFDLGVRYMITSKFGLKLDLANDKISNASGSSSLPFETQQYRIGFQGVINAGRLMGFDEFTKTIGLLIHSGVQISLLSPKAGINKGETEKNGGVMLGITPQIKLSNCLVLTADFTILSNVRQHFSWDGSISKQSNNLNGQMYNTALGITYFFGKKANHADWVIPINNDEKVNEIIKRIDSVEELMSDSDRDGVVDHLDAQNNTPTGVFVDTKGRFLDVNNNGTPDDLESIKGVKQLTDEESISNSGISGDYALKSLVESGSVNIYFDINEDIPNSGSTNSISQIIEYLKQFPSSKITLLGFTDVRGDKKLNLELSERRADKVKKIFIDSGVDINRIYTNPQGVDKNSPSSKTGFELSRRVSIQINR